MRRFIHYFSVFIFLVAPIFSHAHTEGSTTYSTLNIEQKQIWQRLLLQDDAYFRPSNADYYLSKSITPDLAKEFAIAEQYLRGTIQYSGAGDATPWCLFPARFAFVAQVIYGRYFMPEAFTACNLPLPAVDASLKAYVIKTLEPADSGVALFHLDLVVQGKRFYNSSVLTLNIGYGQKNNGPNPTDFNQTAVNGAFRLFRSFMGDGEVFIQPDDNPNGVGSTNGQQSYRINLPPEQIYFLVLLAFETRKAHLPYNLLRANCHSYLEHIFLATLPANRSTTKELFFDYMPAFMDKNNNSQHQKFFEPYRYWASPKQQLDEMAKSLNWNEYQILNTFLTQRKLPIETDDQMSTSLRLAIGKAAEIRVSTLKKSPQVLALHDEYLASLPNTPAPPIAINPPELDESRVPAFNSSTPSAIGLRALDVNGKNKLQLELNVFNTMADQLQAAAPYGFALGKLFIEASNNGLAFDHFMFVEENSVGKACCGAKLYEQGVRIMDGVSIDIVNLPQTINLPAWQLKPQLELNLTRGIGTISRKGWSAQVLPSFSVLSYGEYVDLNVDTQIGWMNDHFAISASKLARIYGPEIRRSTPGASLNAEYKTSDDGRIAFSYKRFDASNSIAGIGYVLAF